MIVDEQKRLCISVKNAMCCTNEIKIQNIRFLSLRRSFSLAISAIVLSEFHYLLIFRCVSICSVILVCVAAAISKQTVFVTLYFMYIMYAFHLK